MSFLIEIAPIALSAIGGLTTVAKSIRFVQEGERGIKLRFGKVVRKKGEPLVVKPGFCFLVPFVDTLHRHHVRQQTIRCDHQEIQLDDKTVFDVSAVSFFRVTDIYKALVEIDNLTSSINDLCMSILRDELAHRNMDNVNQTTEISTKLLEVIRTKADEWGVEFIDFRLTNCSPTPATLQLLLTEQQGKQRAKALKGAADELSIRVEDIDSTLAAALVGIPVMSSLENAPDTKSESRLNEVQTNVPRMSSTPDDF